MKDGNLTIGKSEAPVEKLGKIKVAQPFPSTLLTIDRFTLLDPAEFLGKGWRIWRGPADGDGLTGEEEQDPRALALTEIDPSKVKTVLTLKAGEDWITGEENLRRLKETGDVRLDFGVFVTLWKNQDRISKEWDGKDVYFHGTILRDPHGYRCVLCLYRSGDEWHWHYSWLDYGWDADDLSALLAK